LLGQWHLWKTPVQFSVHQNRQFSSLFTKTASSVLCSPKPLVQFSAHQNRQFSSLFTKTASSVLCSPKPPVQFSVHQNRQFSSLLTKTASSVLCSPKPPVQFSAHQNRQFSSLLTKTHQSTNPFHKHLHYRFGAYFNVLALARRLPNGLPLPFSVSDQNFTLILRLLPICATCPAYLIFLDFVVLTVCGDDYTLWDF